MKTRALKLMVLGFAIICMVMLGLAGGSLSKPKIINVNTGKADVDTFISGYQKWRAQRVSSGADRFLTLSVGWAKGLSAEDSYGDGTARIDLVDGSVAIKLRNLAAGEWEFWLIENHPGPNNSTMPDLGDGKISLGSFQSDGKLAKFNTRIDTNTLANFRIDRVVVTRAGKSPTEFVLTGAPTLYERLQLNHVEPVNTAAENDGMMKRFLFDTFSPISVEAAGKPTEALIAAGRQIFNTETFNGNSRTCATCHPEDNNFTIDPKFIASRPSSDPLFVAEFNKALSKNFEKPELMRSLGVILENVDGFDDLNNKFVLRSVSHTLALTTSITAPDPAVLGIDFTANGLNPNPKQRLGWGGDGSFGSGTLREFAIGAVIQHFTKTLGRKPGTDFRLPTDAELDAMEAFQLSLGRKEDINIRSLVIKNPLASTGRDLYLDTGAVAEPGHKNCNACHFNAGAGVGIGDFSRLLDSLPLGYNGNLSTAVNRLPIVTTLGLPPDGGFGRLLEPDGAFGNFADVPGVGLIPIQEFNTTPLIEAPDTAPYFHNHVVNTLEESIAFYGTDAFQNGIDSVGNVSLGGFVPVTISSDPNDPEVQAIAAFLRVLNVLENVRSSVSMELRAQQLTGDSKRDLIRLAIHENQDALKVIKAGALTNQLRTPSVGTATTSLAQADSLLARTLLFSNDQNTQINSLLLQVIQLQRAARTSLVDPATLPLSFRN